MTTNDLSARFRSHDATVCIVGLGYVGLPLVREFVAAGFRVLGYDIDAAKTDMLNRGDSYLRSIPADMTSGWRATGRFEATTVTARLAEPDAIRICVTTPL
ncbi:MAG: NAD(P)-binding domain-containing protein, partial [Planctomycetota bacterium]